MFITVSLSFIIIVFLIAIIIGIILGVSLNRPRY